MFFVAPKAPSTKLQAFVSGWLDSGISPLSRRSVDPKPALTSKVRTALAPNGLRTMLLTIQNVFSRISELSKFYPVSRCHLPGCPREASNTAYPFARHLPRFRVFSPRPPVKGCLGSCRARPRFHRMCLSAPHGRDQRYVRPTSAIPHFKDEHPNFARLSTR